jgi:hypothetical protein
MSTLVNTWAYPGDGFQPNNTLRTKGKNPGSSSSDDRIVVKYSDGKYYPVETRYNKTDGSSTAVIVVRETETSTYKVTGHAAKSGSQRTSTINYDVPIVLYTTDSEGKTTLGGKGEKDRVGALRGFTGVGSQVTTPKQASAIIATALGQDNAALSQEEFFKINNKRVNDLFTATNKANEAKISNLKNRDAVKPTDASAPAAPAAATEETPEPPVPPHDQDSTGETTTDGTQPGNNVVQQGATIIKEGIDAIADFIRIDPEDIAALEAKLENGGGDPIQGGRYPLDANYGNYYGQDYCCIDQFRYQPPRKEQIFSKDPIKNYSQGNLRITPLKEFVAQVDLPMPNTLADSNNVSWGADVMNNLSAAITSGALKNPGMVAAMTAGASAAGAAVNIQGMGTLGALLGVAASASGKEKIIEKLKDIPNVAKEAITGDSQLLIQSAIGSRILAAAGVEVSPETLLARGLGVVPNSNMELLFNAPTLREFSFNWRLSPRDAREAAEVKKIIRFFKQGMAARTISSQAGDRSLFLGTPNIFRIQFKTANGQIIEGVNRIKPCAVTGTSVNYTPEGAWAAYDQGQPVSTVLSIRVQELEPVYASDYSQDDITNRAITKVPDPNFIGPPGRDTPTVDVPVGESDLYSIRPSEVGY